MDLVTRGRIAKLMIREDQSVIFFWCLRVAERQIAN
jgi:hypothetical protein